MALRKSEVRTHGGMKNYVIVTFM